MLLAVLFFFVAIGLVAALAWHWVFWVSLSLLSVFLFRELWFHWVRRRGSLLLNVEGSMNCNFWWIRKLVKAFLLNCSLMLFGAGRVVSLVQAFLPTS